jgi:serine protease Do
MRWLLRLVLGIWIAALAGSPLTSRAAAADSPAMSQADLIEAVLPAVVNVSTVSLSRMPMARAAQDMSSDEAPAAMRVVRGFGSGFIIDKSGIVITNRHVVENASQITVTLQNNLTLPAVRVGRLSRGDVAILQVKSLQPLPTVKLGDSDTVRVGDPVIAIGNPLGLGGSVSAGIVSGLNRDIRTTPFDDFIQTDAAINHGNSGGPLFNMQGLVVGINTAIFSPTDTSGSIGISFALPINDAKFIIDQTLRYGRVRAGWLGASLQTVTPDIAGAIGLGVARGSIVTALDANGPAARAGVQEGDVIMSVGQDTARDSRAVWRSIAKAALDKAVELTVWRDGHVMTISPVVEELPSPPGSDRPADSAIRMVGGTAYDPGLRLSAITGELRSKYNLPDNQKGVVVTDVAGDGLAADRGILPGQVIVRAGNEPVAKPADVEAKIRTARAQKEQYVLLLIIGQDGPHYVTLPLHPDG